MLILKTLKRSRRNFGFNEKSFGSIVLIFFSSGCIPAYFHHMFYAVTLWIIGFAIMNIHVFILSRKEL